MYQTYVSDISIKFKHLQSEALIHIIGCNFRYKWELKIVLHILNIRIKMNKNTFSPIYTKLAGLLFFHFYTTMIKCDPARNQMNVIHTLMIATIFIRKLKLKSMNI